MRNSAQTIGAVLSQLTDSLVASFEQILVLDNASVDGSADVVRQLIGTLSFGEKITIQAHAQNLGYGGSIKWALKWALELGAGAVAIIHSDDQTQWNEILQPMVEVDSKFSTVVMGSRFSKLSNIRGYSRRRTLGNLLFKWLTALMVGFRMDDPGTAICVIPMRLINLEWLQELDDAYLFHPQLNIILHETEVGRVAVVPMLWHDATEDNHFPLFRYGLRLLGFLIRYAFFHRVLRKEPNDAVVKAAKR